MDEEDMSKDRKLSSNGITDGVIWEQLLLFFFPIVLGIDYFDDICDIKTFIEQNNDGCQSQIRNYNVYYTTNNGTTVATWTSENKIYKIASDSLSSEEVLLFIKTFYGV